MRVPGFWDSSSLIPLCVRQGITPRAISLYKLHEAVIWWGTPVEIASALARLRRMKQLGAGEWTTARKLANKLADSWWVIHPSDALRTRACQLVERYELRAADSFQLAAALEWCEDDPQGRVFLTGDRRLREAARTTGFDVKEI